MPLVTFQSDVYPYVKGDVVKLDGDEKKRVDAVIKARNLKDVYVSGDKRDSVVDMVDDSRGALAQQATASREATKTNMVDQAAQLEAQRSAVGEAANVDALGVVPEHPAQVVTGTEPVADVEVTNPQEATDPGNPDGAKVKGAKK